MWSKPVPTSSYCDCCRSLRGTPMAHACRAARIDRRRWSNVAEREWALTGTVRPPTHRETLYRSAGYRYYCSMLGSPSHPPSLSLCAGNKEAHCPYSIAVLLVSVLLYYRRCDVDTLELNGTAELLQKIQKLCCSFWPQLLNAVVKFQSEWLFSFFFCLIGPSDYQSRIGLATKQTDTDKIILHRNRLNWLYYYISAFGVWSHKRAI